jgi:hypothetical protein
MVVNGRRHREENNKTTGTSKCAKALSFFRTVIDHISLLLYADLAHAGVRPRALSL